MKPPPPAAVRNRAKTHCVRGHAYDEQNTVVRMGRTGMRRECKACRKITTRARHDKLVAAKRCIQCKGSLVMPGARVTGTRRCEGCEDKNYRAADKPARRKSAQAANRRSRARRGRKAVNGYRGGYILQCKLSQRCRSCVDPALEDSAYCKAHRDKARKYQRKYQRKMADLKRLRDSCCKRPQ